MSSRNEKTQGNKQSVLESLYELWIDRDPVYDESVRELYKQIGEKTAQMSLIENDQLSNIVADLCIAYSAVPSLMVPEWPGRSCSKF